ncbi:MAG: sulfite exporter TauE/SafE family protein, partial [Sphaerochaetaceae bacterium]|nr:sulfite exporter TauE/SafE family protein [Sphaerochaetaceae bacterium]
DEEHSTKKTLLCAFAFVLGFTLVFVAMGALAGTLGGFLKNHQTAVNIVSGIIVIIFGLNYLGVLNINFFKGNRKSINTKDMGFISAFVFGIIFSVGWTPCVGAFLGSALMLASQQGHVLEGMMLLLIYSLGLGIPFLLSAVLIDYMKDAISFIKKNYRVINIICGCFLIIVGILMATGTIGKLLSMFTSV